MFAIQLPWPFIEAKRIASHVFEALLAVLLGGAYSTLLVLSTRLRAVTAAAILSVAVFIGAYPGLLLIDADFLAGLVKFTALFFVGGWLIAALGLRIRGKITKERAVAN
jgi:hypothetical protein